MVSQCKRSSKAGLITSPNSPLFSSGSYRKINCSLGSTTCRMFRLYISSCDISMLREMLSGTWRRSPWYVQRLLHGRDSGCVGALTYACIPRLNDRQTHCYHCLVWWWSLISSTLYCTGRFTSSASMVTSTSTTIVRKLPGTSLLMGSKYDASKPAANRTDLLLPTICMHNQQSTPLAELTLTPSTCTQLSSFLGSIHTYWQFSCAAGLV